MEEKAECAGTEDFLANATTVPQKGEAKRKVRNEMVKRMGESFDALAMAAEASKLTYEDQARTIATLTTSNAELTPTIKKLTDKIMTLLNQVAAAAKTGGRPVAPPPGFNPSNERDTGTGENLAGVFMSTHKRE